MLKNYFKIAFRNLWKYPAFSGINVVGLAIGISACLVIYLLVWFELSYDTFHADRERIYRVVSHIGITGETYKNAGVAGALPNAVQQEVTGLEQVVAFHNLWMQQVQIADNKGKTKKLNAGSGSFSPEAVNYVAVGPEYFGLFKYTWLAGTPQAALSEPNKVVLSEKQAKLYFGEQKPDAFLGKTITYIGFNDTITATVSGVVQDWEQRTDFQFTDFISLATAQNPKWKEMLGFNDWQSTNSSSQLFVKLAPGIRLAQVEQQFAAITKKYITKKDPKARRSFLLQPLANIHFEAEYGGNYVRLAHRPTLYALIAIASFLLLIATVNFINLATAQSVQRAKEIGVRKVLGSSRFGLIRQFLSETFVLTLAAVFLAVLFTNPILKAFKTFLPAGIHLSIFNLPVLLFLVGITVVTTLLAGFYPALIMSASSPMQSLKGQVTAATTRKAYLRKTLIVFQFAISQIFIIGTLVVSAQINFLRNKDMGFRQNEIVTFETDWRDHSGKSQVLVNKIKQLPDVAQVSLSNLTPAQNGYNTTEIKYNNGKEEIAVNVHRRTGDENFIKLYGIKLLAGRNLYPSDTLRELLINQTYAKVLGFQDVEEAIGKVLALNQKKLPIVGVVADFNVRSLHTAIPPVFIGSETKYATTISLKLHTQGKQASDLKATMAKIEKEYQALYPDKTFSYTFFDQTIARFYDSEQKIATIVRLATTLAIFIACLGLLGLVAFTIIQRTKEIGIRKVLGASVSSIVSLLSQDFIKLVLLANLVAWPMAWYGMNHWLQDFAYRISINWWIFALAGVGALVIALLTLSFQAIKAAIANPVKALRSE